MKKLFKLVLLLLWMVFIFYMSSQDSGDSSSTSSGFLSKLYVIYKIFGKLSLADYLNEYAHLIRKLAHFTEFGILGVFFYLNIIEIKNRKSIVDSVLWTMIYAISDEIHQLFVPGRACSIIDMIIDTCGGICFIFVYYIIEINVKKYMSCKSNNSVRM